MLILLCLIAFVVLVRSKSGIPECEVRISRAAASSNSIDTLSATFMDTLSSNFIDTLSANLTDTLNKFDPY